MRYKVNLFWSNEDNCYLAEMPELPGCIAHGETQEEALEQANVAAKAWLEVASQMERKIPKPIAEKKFSGRFSLRIPPELHQRLAYEAVEQGFSLNQLIMHKLSNSASATQQ